MPKSEGAYDRVIVDDKRLAPSLVVPFSEAETAHLVRVLRLRRGDRIIVVGRDGQSAVARLLETKGTRASAEVEYLIPGATESRVAIDVAVAMPKGGRAAFLVEKLAELGVHALVPMLTARSVVSPKEGSQKLSRWRWIAREAARQSHRTTVMEVSAPRALTEALDSGAHYDLILVGEPGARVSLPEAINAKLQCPGADRINVLLLVGPEGGFTGSELAGMAARGGVPLCISDGVLRVETAAIVMAAMVAIGYRGSIV
jgi:16S rRNA (uracil1498-N3)-methyltransferase